MELSQLQKNILNSKASRSVVISAAASGKTALLTEKVRQILRDGVSPKDIAVITFTNMAAEELKERLGSDFKEGLFIGTIHSLANYFLLSSGVETGKILESEEFDKLFDLVEEHSYCIKHLKWVLLDEAQDSDILQFRFLFDMINPDCFFIVGDPKQSIYQWKGGDPKLMAKLAMDDEVELFDMNENYRNGANILAYAKRLIRPTGKIDTSFPMRQINGTVTEAAFSLDFILNKILSTPNYGDWAILSRTNQEISTIANFLKKNNIPCDTFKQGDLTKAELSDKLKSNTVKILTIHSAKGLEWPYVIVTGVRYNSAEERNICYVAATRARDKLFWLNTPRKKYTKTYNW